MVENIATIDSVPEIEHLITELRCSALQWLDPDNQRFPNYRKFITGGMVPDKDLREACGEVTALIPLAGSLRLTFEYNGVETHPLSIELLLWRPVTGYVHPESRTGKLIPTSPYMRQRFLKDALMLNNRMYKSQARL